MKISRMTYMYVLLFFGSLQINGEYASFDNKNETSEYCEWKMGRHAQADFNLNTCTWCYFFLFPTAPYSYMNYSHFLEVQARANLLIDYANNASLRNIACSITTSDECNMWQLCCNAARECCNKQIRLQNDGVINKSCKSTWDGFACWEGGTAGTNNYKSCPSYLKFSIPTRMAVKSCLANGTWLKKHGAEWTDYTPCLTYEDLRITLYISLGCQAASLVFLIPSLAIFLGYKFLRKQHRIRLHINFFISFMMSNLLNILWNVLVTYDKLTNTQVTDTLMHKNLASCKVLSFLKMYFTSTNYAWMFCEGFYLYRLIANAFSPPKRLLFLYITGWGVPFTYCFVYAVLRLTSANESCWAISMGDKEWILYAPNLTCLLVNIFFLCSILRILLTQLQAHPNEPSNFRRALKATFVLIPLFGIQLAVTIYRPPPESPVAIHYERFSEVVSNSQGFVVALIFCFFNGEVASQIKRSWARTFVDRMSGSRKFNATLSLHFNNSLSQRATDNVQPRSGSLEPCLNDKSRSTNTSLSTAQTELL